MCVCVLVCTCAVQNLHGKICRTIDNVYVPNGLETLIKLFSYPSYGAPYIRKFVEMYRVTVWLSLACLKASLKVWTFLLHCLLCCVVY